MLKTYGRKAAQIAVKDAHNAALAAEVDRSMKFWLRQQERHKEQLAAEREKHCKDCCCARSWEALGITSHTGMSIPEHIQQLREQLAAEREKAQEFLKGWDWDRWGEPPKVKEGK